MSANATIRNLEKLCSESLRDISEYLGPEKFKSSPSSNKLTTKEIEKSDRKWCGVLSYLAGEDKFTLRLLEEMLKGEENRFFTESFDPVKANIIFGYNFSETMENYKIYYVCDSYRIKYIKSVHGAFPFNFNIDICHSFNKIPKDHENMLVISELDYEGFEFSNYLNAVHKNVFKSSEREFYSTYKGSVSKEIAISLGNESGPRFILGRVKLLFRHRSELRPENTVAVIGRPLAIKYGKEIKSEIPPMPPSAFESSRKHGFPAKIVYFNSESVHLVGKVDALICGNQSICEIYPKILVHLLQRDGRLVVCLK